MVFQSYALFPHMSVRDNVAFGLDVKKIARAERDAKVERILDKFGLADIGDAKPDRLSGGQKQRIALARALVVEPDILLLDEPLGALDANLRKSVQNELKLLQRRLGVTFVFVTHAQSEALALSDRIVVMNAGRIEQVSAPYELYTRPNSLFVARFIGRNAVLPGRYIGAEGGEFRLDSRFGEIVGVSSKQLRTGTECSVAISAEAIDILPHDTPEAYCLQTYGFRPIKGVIETLQHVGHIVQLSIDVGASHPIVVESHTDKYAGRFQARDEVRLAWKKEAATLIVH
jgi:ABC-type Fe3+/spermidine/putrescine transport system ATPase subunit